MQRMGLRLAIEAVDGQAGAGIGSGGDLEAGLGFAADAVFGSVEGSEVNCGMVVEAVDAAAEEGIGAAGASEQADAFSSDEIKLRFEKDFQAEFCGHMRLQI